MSDQPWIWEEDARQLEQALAEAIRERDEARGERDLLRQELRDRAEHIGHCPKRYTEPQMSAGMKTEGVCTCGLDELIGMR